MKRNKTLFIDPGKNLGWAIFSGRIPVDSASAIVPDTETLGFLLKKLLEKYSFTTTSIEKPPTGTFNTQIIPYISRLNRYAGFIQGWCSGKNIGFIEIPNTEIKYFFKNQGFPWNKNRNIRKKQTIQLVQTILGIDKKMTHDEADALCLGLIATNTGIIF